VDCKNTGSYWLIETRVLGQFPACLFSLENIQSGWERTGLLPFNPDAVLSQISLPNEERLNTASSADSKALANPSALELRRLVNKVSDWAHRKIDATARKLKNTIESLQTKV
jgi:hypothetical protein